MSARSPLAVVVTADDFGIGFKTSEGIIQAHLNGPVTATSLMTITGDHVRASIPLLQNAPNLDVGLHLTLTRCGHLPLVAGKSSGLVDRDGNFHCNGRLWLQAFTGKLQQAAVADEIAAQAELFLKLVGRPPTHVDSHHHAHQLPTIRDALLDVMNRGLLPKVTRKTIESPGMLRKLAGARAKRMAAGFVGKKAGEIFSNHRIWSNDYFIGMLAPRDLHLSSPWAGFLKNLPDSGFVEWIVHPGLSDETLIGRDEYGVQRTKELESLTQSPGADAWQFLKPILTRKSALQRLP
jgi:predicted glycoside hydrolase/deacetylase ChbG (UPF0249 family)